MIYLLQENQCIVSVAKPFYRSHITQCACVCTTDLILYTIHFGPQLVDLSAPGLNSVPDFRHARLQGQTYTHSA